MAKIVTTRNRLNSVGSLSIAAIATVALIMPTLASAQDQRGGWRGGQSAPTSSQDRGAGRSSSVQVQQRTSHNGGFQRQQSAPQQPRPYSQVRGNEKQTAQTQDRTPRAQQRDWASAQRDPRQPNGAERRGPAQTNYRNDARDARSNNARFDSRGIDNRGSRNTWQNNRPNNYGHEAWRNNGLGPARGWDRNWRGNDRYNWASYRANNRSVFAVNRYAPPLRGYSYQRLNVGFALNSMFFGSQYWINDPYSYRLPEAHGGFRWIRYYDDVLLVDTYSGDVVDVIYDFFY